MDLPDKQMIKTFIFFCKQIRRCFTIRQLDLIKKGKKLCEKYKREIAYESKKSFFNLEKRKCKTGCTHIIALSIMQDHTCRRNNR